MTGGRFALFGCPIFDGSDFRYGAALLVENERIAGIVGEDSIPPGHSAEQIANGFLAPGLIDLQVNGGGGVLLNDDPSVAGIRRICAAHLRYGTTALLPTLITDVPAKTAAALAAARAANDVPGCIGLHLEGPHLSLARAGAHDPALIRKMAAADLDRMTASDLPTLMVTLAPESVSDRMIAALAAAGVIVSLGHSDCSFDTARIAATNGARCVTHIFNAMSPLYHRQPGMVGAALADGRLFAGLIADGIHVDPVAIGIAIRAKLGPGKVFLVSDSMANIGSDSREFMLSGHLVKVENGRLVRDDGTLAGADLTMIKAVRFLVETIGLDLAEALRMGSLYPAQAIRRSDEFGVFVAGARADIIHCSDRLELLDVWQAGVKSPLHELGAHKGIYPSLGQ